LQGWREEDAEFAHAFGAGQYKTLSRDVSKHIEENLEEAEVETANDGNTAVSYITT
jgi:predicted lipid-binding transport protein (Tim44 family)